MLIVLLTAATVFLLASFWALLTEVFRRKQQDPQEQERLATLRSSLKF